MRKSKEENITILIDNGIEALTKKGYNGTGVQELVDAAGIPKGSFYNYFKSKEDFAIQALDKYSNVGYEIAESILADKTLSPLTRIEKYFDDRIKGIIDSNYTDFCMVTSLCDEMADVNVAIGNSIKGIFSKMSKPLKECLQEAQDQGEIRLDANVEEMAEFIDNSWRGTALSVKAIQSPEPLKLFKKFLFEKVLR
jgi:TetR/AcrR family transcriptional repressor of nem operon